MNLQVALEPGGRSQMVITFLSFRDQFPCAHQFLVIHPPNGYDVTTVHKAPGWVLQIERLIVYSDLRGAHSLIQILFDSLFLV